ncbi:MAG: hypothetical protein MJA30_31030 [Cytophagales bacterium]|nr:hypothetical protein [Cytophagales bacterium]
MKNINQLIKNAFGEKSVLSKGELVSFLVKYYPDWAEQTVNWNIHKLKEEGVIHHVSRGKYSLEPVNGFEPAISNSLKRLHNRIKKEFPYVEFCVWDSRWFNEFMIHQLFRYQLVAEVEKDVLESVFSSITDFSKKAFLNPDATMYERYVSNFDEAIIVKPLVSEAPISKQNGYRIAPLEKLLVDVLIDKNLFAAQQGEVENIYRAANEKYSINKQKMRRYASRRNQQEEVEKYLVKTSAI